MALGFSTLHLDVVRSQIASLSVCFCVRLLLKPIMDEEERKRTKSTSCLLVNFLLEMN
uniref:Uncharacterized protein n=1 Tax=Picea sitchensis TaxID=3332 RepID=D5AD67_PICSI|nr:unknown [Picea sitchensis]